MKNKILMMDKYRLKDGIRYEPTMGFLWFSELDRHLT